ncbi:hypothetical protein ACEWY4_014016 [Coilia grayii]|uniref:PB1 domain-containing protein n=1 Tax=Coilia grayii TaxID=363190 RepID=A0ABD1JR92_9TELE
MACPVSLRIFFNEDDARKITLAPGLPNTLEDLVSEIKTIFGLSQPFRLQYRDSDFGNEYVNVVAIRDIQDKATLKVVFLSSDENSPSISVSTPPCSTSTPVHLATSSCSPGTSGNPYNSPSQCSFSSDHSISSADTLVIDPVPQPRPSWPSLFTVPHFSYCAEVQLETANGEFRAHGTLLNPPPKLRMDILEGMAEEIFKYTAYPSDAQIEEAADVLVHKHPCLRQRGSHGGHEGWKLYLKTKVANFRTKLSNIGLPEVTVNSLKNKRKGQDKAAANIKKTKKAEVNFFPSLPSGETTDSLEEEWVALLTEVKKRNNEAVIKQKMQKTFSYRRKEVVQDAPPVYNFVSRWPALFTVSEINAEFLRLTTVPLSAKFKVFKEKGGAAGKKIRVLMAPTAKANIGFHCTQSNELGCMRRTLNFLLFFELGVDAQRQIEQTTMGIYVVRKEGAGDEKEPETVDRGRGAVQRTQEHLLRICNAVWTHLRPQSQLSTGAQTHL